MKENQAKKTFADLKEEQIRLDNEYKKLKIKKIKLEIDCLMKEKNIADQDSSDSD